MNTTGLPENIAELLSRLGDQSRDELKLIVELADALRSADEKLLTEVRSVTIHHEIRREQIMSELHTLACRLCALPARALPVGPGKPARVIDHATAVTPPPLDPEAAHLPPFSQGASWREAAQRIDAELSEAFGPGQPRH